MKEDPIKVSIRTKLMGLLVGTSAVVLLAACVAFVIQDRQSFSQSKQQTMQILGEAIAGSAYGPTAFQDEESARYVLETLQSEPTASWAAIYTAEGQRLTTWSRDASFQTPEALSGVPKGDGYQEGALHINSDIKNAEGSVGTLHMAFSTHDLEKRTQEFLLIALFVLLVSVIATALASLRLHKVVSTPIARLSEAAQHVLHTQDFSTRVERSTSDEVGALTESFNAMLTGLEARDRELAEYRENLEQKVAQRTRELNRRNQAMRLVLDNVDQGLVTLTPEGDLCPERSRAFDEMFSATGTHHSLVGCLRNADPEVADWFELGWESLVDGFLPLEVALEQLPAQMAYQGRHLQISYKPILLEDELEQILVIISDRTADVEREVNEAAQREFLGAFERILKDKRGFQDFMTEASRLIALVCAEEIADPSLMMRQLHTLKGNFGIFELHSLAHLCHEMESHWEEHQSLKPQQREELQERWELFSGRIGRLLGQPDTNSLEVPHQDLQAALRALEAGAEQATVALMMRQWSFEKAQVRLETIASRAMQIAQRQGKQDMQVVIEDNGVRLHPERWKPFWSVFTHILRNAIDHGIETSQERQGKGKDGTGVLTLRTFYVESDCVVELADNGHGIHWERVAQKAQEQGLPHQTQKDLEDALFSDGFSTRDKVSEFSGRGAGLAAVRQTVRDMGGQIHLQSTWGSGTTFHFHIPLLEAEHPAEVQAHPRHQPSAELA